MFTHRAVMATRIRTRAHLPGEAGRPAATTIPNSSAPSPGV